MAIYEFLFSLIYINLKYCSTSFTCFIYFFQLKIIVNSMKNMVNTFAPSGKVMQMVDQKLVRNISYGEF